MTDLRQAAQQALEALELSAVTVDSFGFQQATQDAITALRTALEQPIPTHRITSWGHCGVCRHDRIPGEGCARQECPDSPQQQAEPVAWDKPSTSFNDWWNGDYDDAANPFEKDSAAYWAWAGWQAAQRQWVGLTDEEIDDIYWGAGKHDLLDARAIEAKLKERNT